MTVAFSIGLPSRITSPGTDTTLEPQPTSSVGINSADIQQNNLIVMIFNSNSCYS